MARNEISEKLATLLTDDWDEKQVVYLFVQVRKLLDHRRDVGEIGFQHLRFYCDWVVHTSKNNIDPATLMILQTLQSDIEKEVVSVIPGGGAINFAYFEQLKPELLSILKEENVPSNALEDDNQWNYFISQLVKVLENQPLVVKPKYGLNIAELVFEPSNPGCVVMTVLFVSPIRGRDHSTHPWYRLMNAY